MGLTFDVAVYNALFVMEVFQGIEELEGIVMDIPHGQGAILEEVGLHRGCGIEGKNWGKKKQQEEYKFCDLPLPFETHSLGMISMNSWTRFPLKLGNMAAPKYSTMFRVTLRSCANFRQM